MRKVDHDPTNWHLSWRGTERGDGLDAIHMAWLKITSLNQQWIKKTRTTQRRPLPDVRCRYTIDATAPQHRERMLSGQRALPDHRNYIK